MITWMPIEDDQTKGFQSSKLIDNNDNYWVLQIEAHPIFDGDPNPVGFDEHCWGVWLMPLDDYERDAVEWAVTVIDQDTVELAGKAPFYGTAAQAKTWAVKQMRAWVRTQSSQGS